MIAYCSSCGAQRVFIHDHVRHDDMCGRCGARITSSSSIKNKRKEV